MEGVVLLLAHRHRGQGELTLGPVSLYFIVLDYGFEAKESRTRGTL
jgi:hypothetical protein